MRQTVLVTGGTGMVGQDLLPRVCSQQTVERVIVLIHRNATLVPHEKIEIVHGDVTRSDLGLRQGYGKSMAQAVTTIIHGAAETSFSSELHAARAVNVGGTRNVLHFAADCTRLKAFCHLSTVYVCGKRTGAILEEELEHNSGFVNAYEQSKYEAEQLVASEAHRIPTAIVRLSTILGRSQNGVVTKIGAIHYALRLFFHSLAPMVPGKKENGIDLIALDYAADSIALAVFEQFSPGSTWHISGSSDVYSLEQFLEQTLQLFYENRPAWRKRAIEKPAIVSLETFNLFVKSVEELGESVLKNAVAMLKSFAPQLAYPKWISDTATQHLLRRSGLVRPGIRNFYPKVIRFLLENNWEAMPQEQQHL
jgi:nucleoside-diphosphate-sugar epimerase